MKRRTLYLALFLFLFAIYLLTYTPHINSSDGLAMFSTAESLVRRGALDIEQIRWMGLQQGTYGLDGLLYSRKGIGVPLGLLPLTWLGLVSPWFGTVGVSLLFNAVVTALTGVLVLAYLQVLGYQRRPALIVALTFGLLTLAWPYAKSLFSDPFSGLLLLASAYLLLRFHQALKSAHPLPQADPQKRTSRPWGEIILYPFLAGLLLGWNVATRYAEALFLPVFGLLLLYYLYNSQSTRPSSVESSQPAWRSFILPITAFLIPLLLIGLSLIAFNLFRYGDPLNTGYLPNETFSALLWQGILGQLVSPGRGLLLYCPIFLLSFVGLPTFLRRFRAEALLGLAVILLHLFLYGKWFMWHGGFAWGPRFMIPTLPFWALFLAPVAAQAFDGDKAKPFRANRPDTEHFTNSANAYTKNFRYHHTPVLRTLFTILAVISVIPQILAVSIDFTPFQGYLLDTGLPLFDPRTFFEIQYSPLLHAWRFIRFDTLDLAWAWQGQLNGWLVVVLLINLGLTGYTLKRGSEEANQRGSESARERGSERTRRAAGRAAGLASLPGLTLVSTIMTVILLLSHTHTLPDRPVKEALEALNQAVRPGDTVILNHPEISLPFAELYKGRAPVLGLNQGDTLPDDIERRLAETIAAHPQVWWLPNWLPPEESAIERTLLATGFPALNQNFGGQRLALFATPTKLSSRPRPVNQTFQDRITLLTAAFPPTSAPGTAFPLVLRWRAEAPIETDYHVFVHLLTENGRLLAQADGQPARWTRPTTTWTPAEVVVDRHGLWLPPAVPPGRYHLLVGLYHPTSGQRLTLPDDSDGIFFEIIVE